MTFKENHCVRFSFLFIEKFFGRFGYISLNMFDYIKEMNLYITTIMYLRRINMPKESCLSHSCIKYSFIKQYIFKSSNLYIIDNFDDSDFDYR